VRWNGAIYHQRWKGFQFSFLGQNSFTEIHNGKDANIDGIETDVNYVSGGLTLNAAAAYTNAKTKGNICGAVADTTSDCTADFDGDGLPDDFTTAPSGTRLPVTPKFKATATARYSWPVFGAAKAHVQGALAYQSSAPATLRTLTVLSGVGLDCSSLGFPACNPNLWLGKIRSAAVVDVFAGLDWPKYSLELYASNLFDKRNDLSRGVNCGSCTRTLVVPGRPRTIGLRAGIKF